MTIIDRRGITVDGTPSSASSAMPSANLAIKTPCRAATTANITLSDLQTIDGVALSEDDRVLVKDQSDATENGIYTASSGNWLRTTDVDGSNELVNGTIVFVTAGTIGARQQFTCTASDPIIPGTSSISFVIVSYQPLDTTLIGLAALNATAGLVVETAADTFAKRTLQGPAAGLSITNPAGTAGDPTFAFANDLAALEALGSTGFAVRTAADTWTQRTITGTANEITVTNGDGVAGAPTHSLPAALTFTGKTVTGGTFDTITTKGTWAVSGTWTIPAVTLGGTVSGGGQQVNNVIIGTSTPLAGSFTTLSGSTSTTTPIVKSAAAIDFQTNGTTYAGGVTTGQQWYLGTTKQAPQTGPIATVSKNAAALPAVGTPAGIVGTAQSVAVFAGLDATPADVHMMSFGNGRACGIRYFQADGTAATRTATVGAGNTLGANFAYSYTGSAYVAACGFIMANTEATVTGSVSGGRVDIYATPTGSTGIAIASSFGAGLMVGTTTDRGAGTINITGGLFLGSFTVGTLPTGVAAGNTAYASNARVFNGTGTQEGAGVGTGGLVNYNGTAWKLAGTNTTAIA